MARLSGVPDATYVALARIRGVAIDGDTSLFEPDRALWNRATLESLRTALVDKFDAASAASLVKLRSLLEHSTEDVVRLAAELVFAQQFFAAANAADKIRNIKQVLSAASTQELPTWVVEGSAFGLADDVAFNQDRLSHLTWLVEMLIGWDQLDDKKALAGDPWKFRSFVQTTQHARDAAQPMREAWLYMMFPDTFENISSRDDKWHIREAFPHVLARPPSDNIDADLLAIRWGLKPDFGEGFHFYSNDVAVHWRASTRTGALPDVSREEILSALVHFDHEERKQPEWIGWEANGNYRFAVELDGRLYPPKHIVSSATKRLKSGFSGGAQTNKYLGDRGFSIVPLREAPEIGHEGGIAPSELRARSASGGYGDIAVARTASRSEPEPEPPPEIVTSDASPHGASKRDVVELLKRDELLEIADYHALLVEDRRVNERLVDAVVRSKKVRLADVLARLSRDRLKEICVALELDDSGREKSLIIERILGEQPHRREESDEQTAESAEPAHVLRKMLGAALTGASSGTGWPMNADLNTAERSFPVSIYVRTVGGSARGNPLERRFQNPSAASPIVDDPDRYELLLGVWSEQGDDRGVIVAFDPYRRMDRATRFSMFMPLSLLEQAADTGFSTHENNRGEILYAFRPENIGRYVDILIKEGTWKKTRPSEPTLKRPAEPRPSTSATSSKIKSDRAQQNIYIRPQVGMYSAFARLNYKPWFALAEFLDNAIQSFLHNRAILESSGHEGPLIIDVNLDDNEISITDRAGGIAWEQFPRAFSPAQPPEDATGLSEFGLGMKAAACWFSKKWNVRTSALGESVERTVSFDIPYIAKTGTESLPIETRAARETDHFTVITMQDLRVHPRGRTLNKIRDHLSSIYRVLTQDGTVRLRLTTGGGVEELNYEPPPLLEAPYFRAPNERSRLWRQEFLVELGDRRVNGWAGIMQTGSHVKAGFSVFRRKRLIEGSVGETYKPHHIFGSPNSFESSRVVGEMFVEGFDVTHTKDGIQWHGYEDEVLEAIHRQINTPKMPLLDQAQGYRVRKVATSLPKDFGAEALVATADALAQAPVQVATAEPPKADGATWWKEPEIVKETVPVVMQERVFKLNIESAGRPWEVHLELVRDASKPFYSTTSKPSKDNAAGDVVHVQINLDHEFSINHINDNEDALQPMIRLVAAIALGEKLARDAGATGASAVRQNANQILRSLSDAPTN